MAAEDPSFADWDVVLVVAAAQLDVGEPPVSSPVDEEGSLVEVPLLAG